MAHDPNIMKAATVEDEDWISLFNGAAASAFFAVVLVCIFTVSSSTCSDDQGGHDQLADSSDGSSPVLRVFSRHLKTPHTASCMFMPICWHVVPESSSAIRAAVYMQTLRV